MTVAEVDAVAQAFHDGVANQDAAALASLYAPFHADRQEVAVLCVDPS
jgi:ketosteroid isomerase-like protein